MPTVRSYKEHEKLEKIQKQSQSIGEFLEWLREETNYVICERNETEDRFEQQFFPTRLNYNDLLAKFFGIDLNKLEKEKRQMLDDLREQQENHYAS